MSPNSDDSAGPVDPRTGRKPARARRRSIGWLLSRKLWGGIATIAGVLTLGVGVMQLIKPDGPPSQTKVSDCSANGAGSANLKVDCSSHTINHVAPNPLNNDPRAQIVQLTGSWSDDGFHKAIRDRDINLVGLYLQSGMKATTLYQGASAILYGFQGLLQNGDPVELVKTFQAAGFKVDDELEDSYLMGKLSLQGPRSWLPLPFKSPLAPKGYVGGYGGTFVGSLLFWIVQRSTWIGTDEDNRVMNYLIDQGADCKVPLAFFEYQKGSLGDSPQHNLMQSCAK